MFILKLFWNVLATIILLVVLGFAGFGAYTLYENKTNDDATPAKSELVIDNNTNNVF